MPSRIVKSFLQFVNEDKNPFENDPEYLYTPEAEVLRDAGLLPELQYKTAREAILRVLKRDKTVTETELTKRVEDLTRIPKELSYRRSWDHATISSTVRNLIKKGLVKRARIRNPQSGRMAYFYSLA